MNFSDPAVQSILWQAALVLGPLILSAAHARGYKLIILSTLFDWIHNKAGVPVVPAPGTPAVPASGGHPFLDALNHVLLPLLQDRGASGIEVKPAADGKSVSAVVHLSD